MVICCLPVGPCEHVAHPVTIPALVRLHAAAQHMRSAGGVSDRDAVATIATGFGRRSP